MVRTRARSVTDDPITKALRPPPDETPEARSKRLAEEESALRRSRAIDEQLANDKRMFELRNRAVKVLLLGQSESGKSTTLKNFQLTFAPKQFHAERSAWRVVVQLNLIATVRIIVDALNAELSETSSNYLPPGDSSRAARLSLQSGLPSTVSVSTPSTTSTPNVSKTYFTSANSASASLARVRSSRPSADTLNCMNTDTSDVKIGLTAEHRKLILRLGPLLQVERNLASAINADVTFASAETDQSLSAAAAEAGAFAPTDVANVHREFFVRAGDDWKRAVSESNSYTSPVKPGLASSLKSISSTESILSLPKLPLHYVGIHRPRHADAIVNQPLLRDALANAQGQDYSRQGKKSGDVDESRRATSVLVACREDILTLWSDPIVRAVLKRRHLDLESYPGFFLDDADRIARTNYMPTDNDVLKARLQTIGVEEHHLEMEQRTSPVEPRRPWVVYDVGGHRSNRHKWIPYFENVDAVIFLASLVFTQPLPDDPSVSRIEDSFALWETICAHPLLARATFVLFLNKVDLVSRILDQGIRVKDYIPSYGNQRNDLPMVIKYFRSKFKTIQKSLSPSPRVFYCHETSVIDAQATSVILCAVREGILQQNLKDANII